MGTVLLTIIKTIFSVFFLPFVVACVLVFKAHLATYPPAYQLFFFWGIISFILIFLFFMSLDKIFEFSHKIIQAIFKFTAPFDIFFANILSLYLLVLLGVFYFFSTYKGTANYNHIFMFLIGFFFALHIVSLSQGLKDSLKIFARFSYLFWAGLAFILNILLIVFVLDKILGQNLFPKFFSSLMATTGHAYHFFFKKIFFLKFK
ncbi:MAG: hypothetical protein HQL24_07365 [Candidatus Omnitrophica bacterium]|nr:hypothetical protein [Candidatus Omnitrophota bacterium]